MTISEARAYVNAHYGYNGLGLIDGEVDKTALLTLLDLIEADASWSPVLAGVQYGTNTVIKVVDWVGGNGVKPAVNLYLGATGYVSDIAQAVSFRGATGPAGTVAASSFIEITADNPIADVLLRLINSHGVPGRGGVKAEFHKGGISYWRIGQPTGDISAFVIEQSIGGGALAELLRIDSGGNLGLGTNAAQAKLHVAGAAQIDDMLRFPNVIASRKVVMFNYADNDHQFWGCGVNVDTFRLQVGATASDFVFFAATGPTASVELARIRGNGRMGIGVSSPAELLDVAGRVKSKGLVSTGSLPTVAITTGGAGTTASATVAAGSNDMAGKITLVTSAGASANNTLLTLTFNQAYAAAPVAVLVTPRNARAAEQVSRVYVSAITANGFTLASAGTALSVDTFDFQYVVIA
ncbi:hypothetical protein [Spirosoma aerolatum]|uniref:hypothetical protein n=1 Tax=Spirosoma aerolatum TaxID=1211326 RepID=UPI0009AE5E20|nr:hypothetical protein [Spirosoma aerolatum]